MLTLAQTQAISELAQCLYNYLPGKPNPFANPNISFQGIAINMNLDKYWSEGSKLPAINQLLTNTLEFQSNKFPDLICEIIKKGIIYRKNKGNPITREEIDILNQHIIHVGFKLLELYDPKFLDNLPHKVINNEKAAGLTPEIVQTLQKKLNEITYFSANQRGFKFEAFLQELFNASNMQPRSSFRNTGEQIDGSMLLDNDTYLIEAKWENVPTGREQLAAFSDKVRSKAEWSRGLFISYSSFSFEGLRAFSNGKPTNIICMDALDLTFILKGKLDLKTVLQRKARRAAETNEAFVSVRELFPNV